MTGDRDVPGRWAAAEIDPTAIEHNVRVLRSTVAPADVWAVVKADGYGHGATVAAEAALRAGAAGLCVALVAEGVQLRRAGVDAPILVLSEQPVGQITDMAAHRLTPTVYSADFVRALDARAPGVGVHVNIDTGMQRVGVRFDAVDELAGALMSSSVTVEGVFSHLACADEPDAASNRLQLERFDRAVADLRRAGVDPRHEHTANTAAGLALPEARRSFVRAGIGIFGSSPGPGVDHLCGDLRPALALTSAVLATATAPVR